jgi:hypothetical protein
VCAPDSLLINASPPWLVQKDAQSAENDKGTAYRTAYTLLNCSNVKRDIAHTNNIPCLTQPLYTIPELAMRFCDVQYEVEELYSADDDCNDDRDDCQHDTVVANRYWIAS